MPKSPADTHLAAAAPDLLEACREALAEIYMQIALRYADSDKVDELFSANRAVKQIKAAIEKGDSPHDPTRNDADDGGGPDSQG